MQNADYFLRPRRNRMRLLRPRKLAGPAELNRFPQARAWGYRLAPATRAWWAFAIILEICNAPR